ncbi:DUF4337 domain-containing protein [Cellulophaga fucicola]|uniref:DUF4337 domain-containing protein n=1 Tax=Cellulophaga fucicola TaxID=76595 RepID=UPI003EBD36A6
MSKNTVEVSVASERAEAYGGVLIAFFAALMAISQLVNGELEEEMMIAHNKVVNYSNWYQSKSIKESLKESELDNLEALMYTNAIAEDKKSFVYDKIENTKLKVAKYKAEKKEILIGSKNLPKKEWVQDLDGKKGVIVGINEWKLLAKKYDIATRKFDFGVLFFQISIVLGAVCIIIYDNPKLQKALVITMVVVGFIGVVMSIYGYSLAP